MSGARIKLIQKKCLTALAEASCDEECVMKA